jgi:hypothetical protein
MRQLSLSALALFCAAILALALPATAQDKPLKVGIISAMDDDLLNAFYDEIAKYNDKVLADARPADQNDADAMVFFLNSWADAKGAPGVADSAEMLKELTSLTNETPRHEITITYTSGKVQPLIFYSVEAVGDIPLTCYAQDIARVLKGGATAMQDSVCEL